MSGNAKRPEPEGSGRQSGLQERTPVIQPRRLDLVNLGADNLLPDKGISGDTCLQICPADLMRENHSAFSGDKAAGHQKDPILETLADPVVMGGHVGRCGAPVGAECKKYGIHLSVLFLLLKGGKGGGCQRQRRNLLIKPERHGFSFPVDEFGILIGVGQRGHALTAHEKMHGQGV